MEPLVIDTVRGVVRGDRYRATGQWVVFWAVLAIRHADGSAMRTGNLRVYRPWSMKAPASVGKEVSRHIANTGAGQWMESEQRTREWRLAGSCPAPTLSPSAGAARRWLEALREAPTSVDELSALVAATVAFHDGRNQDVLDPLAEEGRSPALAAWRDTLRARAAARTGDDDLLESIRMTWGTRRDGSAESRAVNARIGAATVLRDRAVSGLEAAARLRKLASHVEEQGDLATLGVVLNVLGIAERRAGDFDAAVHSHQRAAGLLGLVGDLYSLQGALYNLALALNARAKDERGPRPEEARAALHGCIALCERFDVARDSAQAEVSAARWAVEEGREADALHWLAKAEALVASIESETEWAFFHYVRGLALSRWPRPDGNAVTDLRLAHRLFLDGGDAEGARRVKRAAARMGIDISKKAGPRGRR